MHKRKEEKPQTDIQPLLLTIPQVAVVLGVHRSRVYTLIKRGGAADRPAGWPRGHPRLPNVLAALDRTTRASLRRERARTRLMNFFETLITSYTHEIRLAVSTPSRPACFLGDCFVAQDICDAWDLGQLHTALEVVNDQDRFLWPIETPFGEKLMWCVTQKGMDSLIERNGAVFEERLWMAFLPSQQRLHRTRRGESLALGLFERTAGD